MSVGLVNDQDAMVFFGIFRVNAENMGRSPGLVRSFVPFRFVKNAPSRYFFDDIPPIHTPLFHLHEFCLCHASILYTTVDNRRISRLPMLEQHPALGPNLALPGVAKDLVRSKEKGLPSVPSIPSRPRALI